MFKNIRFSLIILLFIILTNSCDDHEIVFDSGDSGINYFEKSFVLNLEKSDFNATPEHHFNDSLLNQSFSPRLYLGDIGAFGQENISYAVFEIDYIELYNAYSVCDSLISFNDIFLTLKFDNPVYQDGQYMPNNDFYGTGGHQSSINNNANYDFNNIEEDIDLYQTPFYINAYAFFDGYAEFGFLDVVEGLDSDASSYYDNSHIQTIISNLQNYAPLPISRNSDYKVDFKLTDMILPGTDGSTATGCNLEELCTYPPSSDCANQRFFVLLEYNPPNDIAYEKNISLVSTDNYYGPYQPKLRLESEHSVGLVDVLLGSVIDISNIENSTMVIEATDSTEEMIVPTLTSISDIYLLDDVVTLENISDGDNIVAINVDSSSSEFGTFLGYQSPNSDSPPIIPVTDADIELFDIEIEIDSEFDSDSIRFYFSDIVFGYQDINNTYDFGELYDDYGIDQCINELETGDLLLTEFSSEDFCLCGIDVGLWDGAQCYEGSFTGNSWDDESSICFNDNNGDGNYNLCGESSTAYNPEGTENNGVLDWDDENDDGVWEEGEGEEWLDLGLDWLKGTTDYGVDDDYETGCKTPSYLYGIGYIGNDDETYSLIVNNALESGLIDSLNFYSFFYEISDGSTIEFCGQQFWDNPLIDGVPACLTCRSDDPNGDNVNSDPNNDNWKNDTCDACNGNEQWDFEDQDNDDIIDINEEYEALEGNDQWDWIDVNNNGMFDYCDDIENSEDCDYYEPFLDFGINQIPDDAESENFMDDNYSSINLDGTENNLMYDMGELFFDTGIDGLYSYQEENYNTYGRQGNNQVDFDGGNSLISEFKDYGIDNCPNIYESLDGNCDFSTENLYGYDLNLDDYDTDPNNDNYSFNNISGTENNNSWDYEDADGNGSYSLDEEIIIEYDNEEDCLLNNYVWEGNFCYDDSNLDGQYSNTELSETFFEYDNPLVAFVNVGQNSYYYDLTLEDDAHYTYDKPVNDPIYGQDVYLWISKINHIDDNKYSITISLNSFIDIKAFQFKLNHGPYYEQVEGDNELRSTEMIAYAFDDINENNQPDSDEINENIKYIKDVSMYPFIDDSSFSDEMILSYAYGMTGKLYFDDLNNFLNDYNQSVFVAEQQTNLVLSFNIESDYHNVDEDGVQINFTGDISDIISIKDFVSPQIIYSDTEEIIVPIGTLINRILENSDDIFIDSNDVLNAIMYHLEISLDGYSNIFNTIVIDDLLLPQIDLFYSE
tara:strand:- start:26240 stop:29926 length:3687 start_codon:yes stop_codon:yes gene_type:complete